MVVGMHAPWRPAVRQLGATLRLRRRASRRGQYPGGKSTSAIANTHP